MRGVQLLNVILIALFLSSMGCAMSVVFSPDVLNVTEPIVCPEGTTIKVMEGQRFAGSIELVAVCADENTTYKVTLKALFTLWVIFFLPTLLLVTLIGMVRRLVQMSRARNAQVGSGFPGILEREIKVVDLWPQRPLEGRVQRLKELKEMLDAGLITAQEYEAKKADILSEM
jgi:hypothetical protein